MSPPKVTVLMPVYNAERFLREAIDSILIQSFEDFEFVIIDDGSTDRSKEIIRSYVDPRIRFFENDSNIGISETLNKGIQLAGCDLIARMDADDVSYPHRLRKQVEYMKAHPDCALLSTWARVVSEDKRFVRLERYRSEFYFYNLTFECYMYHPTVMFRKQPVLAVGMYSMRYSEDYDLFWKVSIAFEIGNIAEPLLDYRLSPTSLNTVTKRSEYETANEQNVLRNIRYYMGDRFAISKPILDCLRHDFSDIDKNQNVDDVVEALKLLSSITEKMLGSRSPNLNESQLRAAHYFKRHFIITEVCKKLALSKAMELLARTHAWNIVFDWTRKSLQWRFRRLKKIIG
jgi:glycosyltransferase involved in cell wall biosynthesis